MHKKQKPKKDMLSELFRTARSLGAAVTVVAEDGIQLITVKFYVDQREVDTFKLCNLIMKAQMRSWSAEKKGGGT